MCLIIFAPKNKRTRISKATLEQAFFKNDDGAGMAYMNNGQLQISKAYTTFDTFYKAYKNIRTLVLNGPLLIHFRWATCGPNNHTNTQPLNINTGSLVMAHNGVFSSLSDKASEVSDSVVLARLIRRMKWTLPLSKAQGEMLQALCDDSSKLVFVNNAGKYAIINEKLGAWHRGSWYSDNGDIYKSSTDNVRYNRHYKDNDYNYAASRSWSENNARQSYKPECQNIRKYSTPPVVGVRSVLKRPSVFGVKPFNLMSKDERLACEVFQEQERAIEARKQVSIGIAEDEDFRLSH